MFQKRSQNNLNFYFIVSIQSYPAGFVYIYTLFYAVTKRGINIKLAQCVFIAIYLAFMCVVFMIYKKTKRVIYFPNLL